MISQSNMWSDIRKVRKLYINLMLYIIFVGFVTNSSNQTCEIVTMSHKPQCDSAIGSPSIMLCSLSNGFYAR